MKKQILVALALLLFLCAIQSARASPVGYAECEAEKHTTSTTLQDACTLTFYAEAGDYVIATSFELGGNFASVLDSATADLTVNGVEKNGVSFLRTNPPTANTDRKNEGWARYRDLQCRIPNHKGSVYDY